MRRRRRGRRSWRWPAITAAIGLVIAVIWGCDTQSPGDNAPLDLRSSGGWTTPFPNPVIKAGDFRAKALWNDPCVILADGQYVMYMTTSVDAPFQPPILPFRAVSKDARTWTLSPETPLMTPTGTPFVSVETPSVVRFHGMFHMFFTGIYAKPDPAPMAIGHAESEDGIHWTVTPRAVITATGKASDWNGYLVGDPGAIVRNDRIFVYFSAVGARPGGQPPQLQTIGLAKTSDGTTFEPSVKVLVQSSLYPPEKGFAGYSTPAAFELGGHVHLVYDVALYQRRGDPDWQQVALHHAVSQGDGETDFVQDPAPWMTRDDFGWTSGEILGPTALVDGTTLRVWFAGHVRRADLGPMIRRGISGAEFGIGYATRPTSDWR
jgi:hypothetical protein